MRRVVITGAGCISAIGSNVDDFARNLFANVSGITALEDVAAGELHFKNVARVQGFDPNDWLTSSQLKLAERSSRFAIAAARQAMTQSNLMQAHAADRVSAVFGCSTGGRSAEEPETAKLYTQGGRVHPLTVPRAMASAGTSLVCMEHGITGPAYTISTACASASHAIGQAFHMVRSGMVDAAITGGHEAPLTFGFLKSWDSLRVVSPTICRPFAADRDGMTLGEGAAMFTLETVEAACLRNAPILAEIVGFGMSSDAVHMTQAAMAGPAAAMSKALQDARALPSDVGYINAHGTGTDVNDRVEAEAIHLVFGDGAFTLPISSTKSLHGHAMGASGALEVLACAISLQQCIIPGPWSAGTLDESLRLESVLRSNKAADISLALCNSFAFGGLNSVIALRRYVA